MIGSDDPGSAYFADEDGEPEITYAPVRDLTVTSAEVDFRRSHRKNYPMAVWDRRESWWRP